MNGKRTEPDVTATVPAAHPSSSDADAAAANPSTGEAQSGMSVERAELSGTAMALVVTGFVSPLLGRYGATTMALDSWRSHRPALVVSISVTVAAAGRLLLFSPHRPALVEHWLSQLGATGREQANLLLLDFPEFHLA